MAVLYYAGSRIEVEDDAAHELSAHLLKCTDRGGSGVPRETWSLGKLPHGGYLVIMLGPDIPVGIELGTE